MVAGRFNPDIQTNLSEASMAETARWDLGARLATKTMMHAWQWVRCVSEVRGTRVSEKCPGERDFPGGLCWACWVGIG